MLADLSVRGETLVFPSRKISTLKGYMHERIDKGRGLPIKFFLLVFSYWANLYVLAAHIIKLNGWWVQHAFVLKINNFLAVSIDERHQR